MVLKYVSLLAYVALIAIGLSANASDAAFLKQLRNTNLGNLIVWSYWWPAIIILAVFFGRIWCMVCPVEIITTFFAKIGFKNKRPAWLLSGWAITVFYLIILFVGIQGFAIHRNPFFMAIYLLVILGLSIVVGAIFEKNTFCRYVCPVGYLLGMYAKLSFIGWRVKTPDTCVTCKDKSCIHKAYVYQQNYKSCGVDLYPASIEDNDNCILCGGCRKTCERYQTGSNENRPTPQLTYLGFASELLKVKPLKMAEMVFVLVVSGFVMSEIWSEWNVTDKLLSALPDQFIAMMGLQNQVLQGFAFAVMVFGILPFLIWIIPFLVSRLAGSTINLKTFFLLYGVAFIPIIASAHIGKALLKTSSRLPYFHHLFEDISGISTAQQILDGTILLQPNPVWMKLFISILLTVIILAGVMMSFKVVKITNKRVGSGLSTFSMYLIPLIYGGLFISMILAWRWL